MFIPNKHYNQINISNLAYLFTIFNFGSDLSLGFITTLLLGNFLNIELSNTIIFLGMLFAVLPDIDMFFEIPLVLLKKAKENSIHREYTHYPLIYIPIGILIFSINSFLGILFLINITLHFLHDSIGTAWGIAWLYPFKNNYYKFFSNSQGIFSTNIVQSWTPKNRNIIRKKYGDPNWVENLYLHSYTLSNLKISKEGPSLKWLKRYYARNRWFFCSEIIITLFGIIIFFITKPF